jgi:hypothetical protein
MIAASVYVLFGGLLISTAGPMADRMAQVRPKSHFIELFEADVYFDVPEIIQNLKARGYG